MVRFFDPDRWNEIWETIARNRRRSIMTALGVFWGLFLLIVLLGAGTGLGRMFRARLGGMATNTVFMHPDQTTVPYKGMPSGRTWELNVDDVAAVSDIEPVEQVSAVAWGGQKAVTRNTKKGDYSIMGYSASMQKINPAEMIEGRYLNDVDEQRSRKVAVIGEQVKKDLFGDEPAEGQTIQIGNSYFTVVGVMKSSGSSFSFGGAPEQTIVLPVGLMQTMWGSGRSIQMLAFVGNDDTPTADLIAQARQTVSARHLIAPEDEKAMRTIDFGEMFSKVTGLFGGISLLTWIVGLGTLLAGLVGISNIMLVLVRERTQEIGIRRALGAAPRTILSQILSESFVLSFVAGFFGFAAGVGLLSLVDTFYGRAVAAGAEMPEVSWQVSFSTGMTALGILVVGGLLAGVIPATRALRIKAVDAIREE